MAFLRTEKFQPFTDFNCSNHGLVDGRVAQRGQFVYTEPCVCVSIAHCSAKIPSNECYIKIG